MFISSLFVLVAIVLGIIASYFLIQGARSISFEEIRDQTKRGWWANDNTARAKSMITEKARAYYGFCLLCCSFLCQLIALFINEIGIKKTIPMTPAIIVSAVFALITFFITKCLVAKKERKVWQEYQKIPRDNQKEDA